MNWKKIKLVSLYISKILSILLLLLSLLLLIVDPVAIIFTYLSVLFLIPSVFYRKTTIVKIYIVLFLIANSIFLFHIYKDLTRNNSIPHTYTNNPFEINAPQ